MGNCIHSFKLKGITKNSWDRSYSPSELTNYGWEESAILYCTKCLEEISSDSCSSMIPNNECTHEFQSICSLEKYEYNHYRRNDRSGYCSATQNSTYANIYYCKNCGAIIKK